MPHDYKLYLEYILEAIDRIERYLEGVSFEEFADDSMRVDAVLHNLLIIGEAVKDIPETVKRGRTSVDWAKIAGLPDIVAHRHMDRDLDVIWDVVQNNLATLRHSVRLMLDEEV